MTARHSRQTATHVVYGLWLVFDREGGVRMTRAAPALSADEKAVAVEATLPLSLWRTPQLRATLTVETGEQRDVVTSRLEVGEEALRQVLGVEVLLELREPGEE